jgi:hypothetical protein
MSWRHAIPISAKPTRGDSEHLHAEVFYGRPDVARFTAGPRCVRRARDAPPVEDQTPNSPSVEILQAAAEGLIEDERQRGRALDAKTAQLATFSGTILTLDVALGTLALRESLGSVADVVLPICFLVAAGGLVVAAGFAVGGVLMPQRFLAIDRDAVKGFARYPLLSADPTEVRARLLTSITDVQLPRERERNNRKAVWTKWAAIALLVGLFGIAGQATTIGLDQFGI